MFTVTAASTRNVTVCGTKKTQKEFRKFGKRLARQRRDDLDLMGQRVKDIVKDERSRAQTLVDEHQEFLEKIKPKKKSEDDDDVSFFDLDSE
jgi:hypothetical protein